MVRNRLHEDKGKRTTKFTGKVIKFEVTKEAEIAKHIFAGWRPEHNAMVNTLRRYNNKVMDAIDD